MNSLRKILTVALLVTNVSLFAQDCGVGVPRSVIPGGGGVGGGIFRRPPPPDYPKIREADVMWTKRYWRIMDLREKINHPYFFPVEPTVRRQNLITVFLNSICMNELTAYDPITDEFTVTLTRAEVVQSTSSTDTIFVEDEFGDMAATPISNPFDPSSVKRFRLKEDWFFHNARSRLEKRIIGICPVAEKYDENGEYKGEMPLFWIYFPESRPILRRQYVLNHKNRAEPWNFDQLLQIRYFSSYLYKESNVYDRKIADYKTDLDALLEAEKIETELFNLEQDLWEY